jgi:outer membrane lipoprotein-sorting protein
MTRTWRRWAPAVVVPVVIAAGALVSASQAGAAGDLPDKSAEQVLAMVGSASVPSLSGTIEQTSDLGLPALPSMGPDSGVGAGSGVGAALELLTGSHTVRVYVDGPTRFRAQILDPLAERDAVRNGDEVWLYSSASNTATHVVLPAGLAAKEPAAPPGSQTPAELARTFLAAIDSSTSVSVGRDTVVAGRSAYDLVLTPRTSGTLVGSVSIAVDSETGLPLRVEIDARGQAAPAFQLAFTDLRLGAPPAARFQFTPPPGATVTEQVVPPMPAAGARAQAHAPGAPPSGTLPSTAKPTLSGTGWETIVEVPVGDAAATLTASPLLGQVTRAVPGGRSLHSALLNVLLTDDGRLLVGSVPLDRLEAAAAAS